MTKTKKNTPKETKELTKLRIAYENDMKKVYGNKPATPPDVPSPIPKPKPVPPPVPPPPIPKPKPVPPPDVPPPEPVKQVGVEILNNINRSFWKDQSITTLKLQCELGGKRFTDAETKGTTKFSNGKNLKVKGMKKQDYLLALYNLLKI